VKVSELLGGRLQSSPSLYNEATAQAAGRDPQYIGKIGEAEENRPTLFTIRLIMDPGEVELLDGKLVFERRVCCKSRTQAINMAGVSVTMS